ncbi:MAG: EAL domain-containing protein [Pyrinomonadaceae bacterium]|nr:EAL domain-containing protein [Pyrinomonadaceae bacterium]
MDTQRAINFRWFVIVVGVLVCVTALYNLPVFKLDVGFVVLVIFTVTIGSRLTLRMPRSKLHFTMGDALVFLAFMLYGGEAAILLAAFEAFCSSLRLYRKKVITNIVFVFLNPATMACSVAAAYLVLRLYSAGTGETLEYDNLSKLFIGLGLISLTLFAVNSGVAALHEGLRDEKSVSQIWLDKCMGNSISCVVSAVFAGFTYKLIEYFNIYAFLVALLIGSLLYFSFRRYVKEVSESQRQAELAEVARLAAEELRAKEAENHLATLSKHLVEQERVNEALRVSKERFQHISTHDVLTGLANRSFFLEQVKFLIDKNRQKPIANSGFCILFLDLDKFKNINDSLGHVVGDQILVLVARRLENAVRQSDIVTRLGGDEFAIILNGTGDVDSAANFAERIRKSIAQPFRIESHQVFTVPSIGIALNNEEYNEPEEILRDADIAMYHAKEQKSGCAIFDRELRLRTINVIKTESELRYAIERDQLKVYFQPIVSLESGFLAGFEALLRWQHPTRGLVSPLEFIPIAEASGQIIPITNWVLTQSCEQLSRWRWRSVMNRSLFMSVNLSGRHFAENDLVESVKKILSETGLESRCLKLEITEGAVMENPQMATDALRELREAGIQISIDDFGTGYSSLSYLHKFPIDTLKIDRSFVSRMGENGENCEIIKTIIALGQNLGMQLVAEGIETPSQLYQLRDLGCCYGQGYLMSKPIPQLEIDEIMKTQKNWLPEGVEPLPNLYPISSTSLVQGNVASIR